MALCTKIVKISGIPSFEGWSYSCNFIEEIPGKNTPTRLVLVFSTSKAGEDVNNLLLGKEVYKKFQNEFITNENKDQGFALKSAVSETFNQFFQNLDGLEIAAACQMEDKIYVSCINGGKVSLFRDNFVVKILDSNSPQVVSATGFPMENDVIVLATSDFFKTNSLSEVKTLLEKGLDNAKDELSVKISGTATASVSLIKFEKGENNKSVEDDLANVVKPVFVGSNNLKNIVKNIKSFTNGKSIWSRKSLYLRNQQAFPPSIRSKKTLFTGILLTIILIASVVFGLHKDRNDKYRESYSLKLTEAKRHIDDAVLLKSVDLYKSREELVFGKKIISELISDGIKDPEIDDLKNKISENEAEIFMEKRIETQIWLDPTLIIDDYKSDFIELFENEIYLFDKNKDRSISVDLQSKKSKTIKTGSFSGEVYDIGVVDGDMYLLDREGIYNLSENKRLLEKDWQSVKYFSSYASNIYLIDESAGSILKSSGTDNGFSEPKKWTTSEKEDFGNVSSFCIDGSIWVLTEDGPKQYSYGNRIKFELKGYPNDIPKYEFLYTNDDLENLYFIDKDGGKISIFAKDGNFKQNLLSDIVSESKGLVVSEEQKKIILLTREKLYEVKI